MSPLFSDVREMVREAARAEMRRIWRHEAEQYQATIDQQILLEAIELGQRVVETSICQRALMVPLGARGAGGRSRML